MDTNAEAVDLGDVVHVLRLARDGWPDDCTNWTTDAFTFAAWNGFFTSEGEVELTSKGRDFLEKTGSLYPEAR